MPQRMFEWICQFPAPNNSDFLESNLSMDILQYTNKMFIKQNDDLYLFKTNALNSNNKVSGFDSYTYWKYQ